MDGLYLTEEAHAQYTEKQENQENVSQADKSDPLVGGRNEIVEPPPVSGQVKQENGDLPPPAKKKRLPPEWNEFTSNETSTTCRHCGTPKIDRIQAHLAKCPKYFGKSGSGSEDDYVDDSDASDEQKAVVVKVKSEVSKDEEIDEAIARFFYEANVPPIKAENMHFRSMIFKLRPNYSAPDRYQLEKRLMKFRQRKK